MSAECLSGEELVPKLEAKGLCRGQDAQGEDLGSEPVLKVEKIEELEVPSSFFLKKCCGILFFFCVGHLLVFLGR